MMKNSAGGISADEHVSKHLAEWNQPLTSEWFCPPWKPEIRDSNNSRVVEKCIYKKKNHFPDIQENSKQSKSSHFDLPMPFSWTKNINFGLCEKVELYMKFWTI